MKREMQEKNEELANKIDIGKNEVKYAISNENDAEILDFDVLKRYHDDIPFLRQEEKIYDRIQQ